MTDADWAVRKELATAMLADLEKLTSDLVADIQAHSALYSAGRPVTHADLRGQCRQNLQLALEEFGGLPPTAGDIHAAATATGRRRAEQGMPLDTVLGAYRRGGRVIWQAVADLLRHRPPVGQEAVGELAGTVWEIIDGFSAVMANSYRLTTLELQHRQDSRRGALFEALLDGRGGDPAVAGAAAVALGVPQRDHFAVVVLAQNPAAPPDPSPALEAAGLWSFWRPRGEVLAGLVRLGTAAPARLTQTLSAHLGCTAGISPPFEDLAQADEALRLSERALGTLPAGGGAVAELDERLVEALLCADPEMGERLVRRYLAGVLASGAERPVLLETLRIWLDTGCSASRTAEQLYCHRNTVLNRVGRIGELTGWPTESGEARLGWALGLRALERAA
ncbi:helix-turn-helix domain-containing protein [Streptomyces sp. NPDC051940]|uniref:PucR family transcriptional regulator n=1 Tax=Streptomyces sp. NPDC051940 TaxID=3155675 RepID=UPI003448A93C